ncbi:MAG: hypothetical protein WAR83_08745 [Flavobacteriales bacterium]|nr:hypothetical protein [Flavobacteriales bacterium]
MITIFEDPAYIFRSLNTGATGYFLKTMPSEKLEASTWDVNQGGSPMKSTIARMVARSFKKKAGYASPTNFSQK